MDGVLWLVLILVPTALVWRDWRRSGLYWFDYVILRGARVYARFWHRWSIRGAPLPNRGPYILISNHTCSADPPFLLSASYHRPLSFLVAREHYNVHWFCRAILEQLQCIEVERCDPDPTALRCALRHLRAGKIVTVFPEGNLSAVALGRPGRPKAGMAFLALATRAPVIPVSITGGPRTERLLESWVRRSRKAVRVTIGRPIDLRPYYDLPRTRQLLEEITLLMMQQITALGDRTGLPTPKRDAAFLSPGEVLW